MPNFIRSFRRVLTRSSAIALVSLLPAAAKADTLVDALVKAYQTNPQLAAQRAVLRQSDEGVSRAIGSFLPTVTGTYNETRTDGDNTVSSLAIPGGSTDSPIDNASRSFAVRGDQTFFRGGQRFADKAEQEDLVRAGRAQLLTVEQQVLFDTVSAYMNVFRDQAVLELNTNNVQVLRRQLQASQDRFRVGEITRTDVAQSEARLAGAIAQQTQAEAVLAASRAAYRRLTGELPGTLEAPPSLPPLPGTEDEAIAVAQAENPNLANARFNEEAAKHAVQESKGALLPTITGFAQYSDNTNSSITFFGAGFVPFESESQSLNYGFQATVPFFQGGAEYADVRRAKQLRSQRMLEISLADRQVREQVRVAWENLRSARSQIQSTQSQVRANEIALEGVRQEAAVGSRTTLDVLDAEQELLNSRVNLVTAQRDQYVAGFQLLQSVGRLNAKSLSLPVELYDPERYYKKVKWKLVGWGTDN